ncbi:MAG: AMP-binding protein [Bryobacteraceae bacterium]
MTLNDLFELSLTQRSGEPGLEWQGQTTTFGELGARARRTANALRARGFEPGDRLCVQLANCVEMIDLFLACVRLGVIFVPVNVLYREREVSHILRDAEPRLFLDSANLDEFAAEALRADTDCPPSPLSGDSPAALVYTSGTTGTSKGAILTHNNFAANAINLLTCWQITAADRFLLALPLFHVHALGNGLQCWLLSGCRMRLLERFERQKAAVEFLNFQPTLFFGVPTVYTRLLDTDPDLARIIGSRMRLFVSGSAPLPSQVLQDFHVLFGHTILERSGMTETLMNRSNPYMGERRQGSVGFPLPGVSVRLLDDTDAPVGPGETGEVYLKGPNVFPGYWRNEPATRAAFRDGWFRTGDLATVSPDGYYTLAGRRSDLIISGGFNIYPREIEEFLLEQPEVAEAAVAGVPDPIKGEVPLAWVVLRSECDPAVLEKRCRANLASFKVPRKFLNVDALPRNALGKVQKHLLPR